MAFDTTKPALPTNASQETGGNLAITASQTDNILSLLYQILMTLQAIRIQQTHAFDMGVLPSELDDKLQ